MNIADVKQNFPGAADRVFLDSAAVSLTPIQAQKKITDFLELAVSGNKRNGSELHLAMDDVRNSAFEEATALLNTNKRNIALIESTTHGLNIAANALPLSKGDNVLIADTEYLQVAIPWAKMAETKGIEVKPVQSTNGLLSCKDFEDVANENTKAICVSSVQWCTGQRVDIEGISKFCRDRNIWLVVDAIQEMGAMQIDLSNQYADFVMAGGHKWLCSPFGCGLMFISDRALEELQPSSFGYLALSPPEQGWAEYFRTPEITPFRDYTFPKYAKTFEIGGTSNYPGAAGLSGSLKLFNSVGTANIEKHIRSLTDILYTGLNTLGANIISSPKPEHRSGITIFRMFDDTAKDRQLLEALVGTGIAMSIRYTSGYGGLRVSAHLFNTEDDIHSLISKIKSNI